MKSLMTLPIRLGCVPRVPNDAFFSLRMRINWIVFLSGAPFNFVVVFNLGHRIAKTW